MSDFFNWAFTDPSDPTGGLYARLLGIEQPPSSPIVPGMIPNRSTAGMGGPLGLGQTSPFMGALGGAARGYAMGGGSLGAVGGAIGGGVRAALTPALLSSLGLTSTATAGASGLASILPFLGLL
jgi:hypothetical protein